MVALRFMLGNIRGVLEQSSIYTTVCRIKTAGLGSHYRIFALHYYIHLLY